MAWARHGSVAAVVEDHGVPHPQRVPQGWEHLAPRGVGREKAAASRQPCREHARLGIRPAPNLVPGGLLETPCLASAGWLSPPFPHSTKPHCPLGGLLAAPSLFCSLNVPLFLSLWERSRAGPSPPSSSPSPAAHHCGIRPRRAHFRLPSCLHQAASVPLRAAPCNARLGWGGCDPPGSASSWSRGGPATLPKHNNRNTLLGLGGGWG